MQERKKPSGVVGEFLQNQSVFNRIFVSLMTMFTVMILVVTFWVNQVSSRGQQIQIMKSNLARMEAANRTLEQVLDDLTASMTQLLWETDFLKYLLLPVPEDQNRFYAIQKQLNNVSRSTWAVKQISFFCDYSKKIFRSDTSSVYTLEDFPDAFLFGTDWEEEGGSLYFTNQDRKTTTWLIPRNGRLFLIQNLFMGKSLGSVVYELNTAIVNGFISNDNGQPEENIYLYDQKGRPVLTGVLTYPLEGLPKDEEGIRTVTTENVDDYRLKKSSQFYCVQGMRVPWTYLKPVHVKDMQVTVGDTVRTWLPALLVLLLASFLVTAYVIRSIYRPLNRLLRIAGQNKGEAGEETTQSKQPKNEFLVLENAYSRVLGQQEQMSQILENVAPNVLDSVLLRLLHGPAEEPEQLAERLREIESPIPPEGRFLVCACRIDLEKDKLPTDQEWKLLRDSINNLVGRFSGSGSQIYPVRTDPGTVVLFLSFPEETSAVAIKRKYVEVRKELLKNQEVLPFVLYVESSHIFSHLEDSREAFLEALERIEYRKQAEEQDKQEQAGEGLTAEGAASVPLPGRGPGTPVWNREKVQEILSILIKGERQGAILRLEKILEELNGCCETTDDLKAAYEGLLEELTEKALTYPLTAQEQEMIGRRKEDILRAEDGESMQMAAQEHGRELCQLIYTYNRKSRYKYVDQAREYIAEHYRNSDMSLNDVAEHIGISASYLSELFVESNGSRFSSYLASYRVEKARKLLQTTTLPAKDIGLQCGFNSVQNFNRVFKKVTGQTPGQYRESTED